MDVFYLSAITAAVYPVLFHSVVIYGFQSIHFVFQSYPLFILDLKNKADQKKLCLQKDNDKDGEKKKMS